MLGIKHYFHTPSLHLNHTLDQRKKANTEVVRDFVIGLLLGWVIEQQSTRNATKH